MESLFPTKSSAVISDCGKYRYLLRRTWDESKPPVCWIMFNPSTADADTDNPTIRKCCGFARAWGAGGIVVVNLFAYRSTDPKAIIKMIRDGDEEYAVGPQNDAFLSIWAANSFPPMTAPIIAAWGSMHAACQPRIAHVRKRLAHWPLKCLRLTKDGHPWHPLYVPYSTTPIPFKR